MKWLRGLREESDAMFFTLYCALRRVVIARLWIVTFSSKWCITGRPECHDGRRRLQGGCRGVTCAAYLNDLVCVADLPSRRRFRLSSSHQPLVPSFRLTTVGLRTFPVAVSLLCNSLSSDIQSSPSLPVFLQRLKTFLFSQSFPSIAL